MRKKPEDWSRAEVEATVSDYLEMLSLELRGEDYNKAEHNRNLRKLLNNRSPASVEKKHQNISAILIRLEFLYIEGYKPLWNYQHLLREIVEDRLNRADYLRQLAGVAVERPIETPPVVSDILSILVPPPKRDGEPSRLKEKPSPKKPRSYARRNFLEDEANNRSLGLAGEELVLHFERERLLRAGKKNLADRVKHVSQVEGDHLGYDILSFETQGRERLVEVKTTSLGISTPFYATRNEVNVSETRESEYQVYRLFSFKGDPKLFILPGPIGRTCTLDPVLFSATPISPK